MYFNNYDIVIYDSEFCLFIYSTLGKRDEKAIGVTMVKENDQISFLSLLISFP